MAKGAIFSPSDHVRKEANYFLIDNFRRVMPFYFNKSKFKDVHLIIFNLGSNHIEKKLTYSTVEVFYTFKYHILTLRHFFFSEMLNV